MRFWFLCPALSAVLFMIGGIPKCAMADQVGIDKVRLFEEREGEYSLEVDTTPRFVSAYGEPILPSRFAMVESSRDRQPGFLVLRYRFKSEGNGLGVADEILLPWGRAGAAVTVRWRDGSVRQQLFLRDVEGIRVPMRTLIDVKTSTLETADTNFRIGIRHALTGWSHWLLALGIAILATAGWRLGLVAVFAAGQASSMFLSELGLHIVTEPVVEACTALAVLLLARSHPLNAERCRRFAPVFLVVGALHGVAVGGSLSGVVENDQYVEALFFQNVGVDVVQLLVVGAVTAAALLFGKEISTRRSESAEQGSLSWASACVGGCAFALLLIALTSGAPSARATRELTRSTASIDLKGQQNVFAAQANRPQPAKTMQNPVACFMAVEPYETRLEILSKVSAIGEWLNVPVEGDSLPVAVQQAFKDEVLDLVGQRVSMTIDTNDREPDLRLADLVTLEPNGVFSRTEPVDEPVDQAVVGVTLGFATETLPERITINWDLFSPVVESILATVSDPFGGMQRELNQDEPTLEWTSRVPGYMPDGIRPVPIEQSGLPLLSFAMLALAAGVSWFYRKQGGNTFQVTCVTTLLLLASVAYPFVRTPMATSYLLSWNTNAQQMGEVLGQILTNVYRAYDMRDEDAIYDRLANTVTGDQLTDIFLDTRRSLELENRGGARAKVEQVQVREIHAIDASDVDGVVVDLTWEVSGSVTHFGHTHYRRNLYRAKVVIVPMDGVWKISAIEVGQQERLL